MPTYDALPDKPAYEDSRRVLYNELRTQRYGMEDLVAKAINGNINACEWLGEDISRRAARIIPEGYRWDRRNQVLIPNGWAFCRNCKKIKPASEFGKDGRNTGRNGTRSYCSACESFRQTRRNRRKAVHSTKWKRG
jgi:hypothetical protein